MNTYESSYVDHARTSGKDILGLLLNAPDLVLKVIDGNVTTLKRAQKSWFVPDKYSGVSSHPTEKTAKNKDESEIEADAWTIDLHKLHGNILSDFQSHQKYEGVVTSIDDESFVGRLKDLTGNGPDEEAQFLKSDISPDDMPLLEVGSEFYWNIGYLITSCRQRYSSNILKFRRFPTWTAAEIKDIQARVSKIQSIFAQ